MKNVKLSTVNMAAFILAIALVAAFTLFRVYERELYVQTSFAIVSLGLITALLILHVVLLHGGHYDLPQHKTYEQDFWFRWYTYGEMTDFITLVIPKLKSIDGESFTEVVRCDQVRYDSKHRKFYIRSWNLYGSISEFYIEERDIPLNVLGCNPYTNPAQLEVFCSKLKNSLTIAVGKLKRK